MGWFQKLFSAPPASRPAGSPRAAHYALAHLALRQIAFDRPETFFGALAMEDAPRFLEAVFKLVDQDSRAQGEVPDFDAGDLHVHPGRIMNHPLVVIELPPPQAVTEAHFVGAVLLIDVESQAPLPEKLNLRYFTLEKAADGTVLGEWTADGTHRHLGPGGLPERDEFIRQIQAQL
ncbi:MAG TPA: hypothetical protein VL096_07380 [Pirellulaceae bacterium]|nr:hypothetical protein [Pirellulaceae bacterium]